MTFARLEMRFPLDRRTLKKAMGFCGAVSLSFVLPSGAVGVFRTHAAGSIIIRRHPNAK